MNTVETCHRYKILYIILSRIPRLCGGMVTNNYDEGSDWIPDLFTMEIYSCTHYSYNEHLALVAPLIPKTH
jgi:hypothetical protein